MLSITDPRLQRLYQYWLAKRGDRAFPARADLDPVDMGFVIGNLILIDVIDGSPLDFRIRLHGTNLVQRVGYELTGKTLDALPQQEFRAVARDSFTQVAGSGKPLHAARDRFFDERRHRYETIILPLSADGERVDMLLCGMIYDDDTR